jgi:hypothetical protein
MFELSLRTHREIYHVVLFIEQCLLSFYYFATKTPETGKVEWEKPTQEPRYGKQTWGTLRHFDSSSGHSCSFDRSEPVTEEACHAGHHVLARYTLLLIFA